EGRVRSEPQQDCSSIHGLTPRCARGQPAAVQNRSRRCVFVPSWDSPLAALGASLRLSKIVPDVVCSSHPGTHPSLRSGPAYGCPNLFLTNLSNGVRLPAAATKTKEPTARVGSFVLAGRLGFEPR